MMAYTADTLKLLQRSFIIQQQRVTESIKELTNFIKDNETIEKDGYNSNEMLAIYWELKDRITKLEIATFNCTGTTIKHKHVTGKGKVKITEEVIPPQHIDKIPVDTKPTLTEVMEDKAYQKELALAKKIEAGEVNPMHPDTHQLPKTTKRVLRKNAIDEKRWLAAEKYWKTGKYSLRQLAEKTGISYPAITRFVLKLEGRGRYAENGLNK
jgi:hypothetical protein